MAIASIANLTDSTVAGNNTEIQYNNSGVFGASSNLTFDGSTLTVTGAATITGNLTLTGHPTFLAASSGAQANVTGDGTLYSVQFGTEITDKGADFASNTFTAPVTGTYLLNASVEFSNRSSGHDATGCYIITSNRTYHTYDEHDPTGTGNITSSHTAIADMDAGDTATVSVYCSGGTKTVTVGANASDTVFGGHLLG